ncbi:hypothetical protein [Nonomuraea turkmeniaca]|uniref:hypothetical protein n=1 Tax=Nonomuraea turkmeniaca TaxID=103838 RepID=UPI001FE53C05|nr:hypothetical protein [Nonomuraea turkmeniaca]
MVGGGNRFFPDDVRVNLELLDERRFGNGVVICVTASRTVRDGVGEPTTRPGPRPGPAWCPG